MSVLISVRIPKKLKEEAKKLKINISDLVRKSLEEEIKRRRLEMIKKLQEEVKVVFSRISSEEIVRAVRESRDER